MSLDQVFSLAGQKEFTSALSAHLATLPREGADTIMALDAVLRALLADQLSSVLAKAGQAVLIERLASFHPSVVKRVGEEVVTQLAPRVISFEESLFQIRKLLADVYESEGSFLAAATTLAAVPMESGQKTYSDEVRFETYTRIGELYIIAGNLAEAETALNRASMLYHDVKTPTFRARFVSCTAETLDRKEKFLEAAFKYNELSHMPSQHDETRLRHLQRAVISCVLAGAGPRRSKLLAVIFKDERCQTLPVYGILVKTNFDQIISATDVASLQPHLSPHHLAIRDGISVLERAVMEHNVLAASQFYSNISFSALSALLSVTPQRAEETASQMVAEGRLQASIDQVESLLYFEMDSPMVEWNQRLTGLCSGVTSIAEKISALHPQWLAQYEDTQMQT